MKPTILLVENILDTRESTTDVLESEGYNVLQAASVEEARAILEKELVHVALIDVRLTKEDRDENDVSGLELCKQMGKGIPRVVLSAFKHWQAVRPVAESLVSKASGPETLLAEIRHVLTHDYDLLPHRRFAILTSGGDSPGMNAAIWSALRTALAEGIEMFAINDGYQGLIEDRVDRLRWRSVADTLMTGGTMLGTARSEEFKTSEDSRRVAARNLKKRHIDGLIVMGGDGSMQGAQKLVAAMKAIGADLKTIALPGTIDNDLSGTDMSIGAASSVAAVMHEINNMVAPARALRRVFICEIMGRHSGFLTLEAGLCVGAEAVLLPEELVQIRGNPNAAEWSGNIDYHATRRRVEDALKDIAKQLELTFVTEKRHAFVLFSEGIRLLCTEDKYEHVNLDTITRCLRAEIAQWKLVPKADVRSQVIGYPMRGAAPSRYDMHLGTTLGAAAVRALIDGKNELMLGWSERTGTVIETPFDKVIANSKRAPAVKYQDPERESWRKTVALQRTLVKPLPRWF